MTQNKENANAPRHSARSADEAWKKLREDFVQSPLYVSRALFATLPSEPAVLSLAGDQKVKWAKLKTKNQLLKRQLQTIFNQFYTNIPSAVSELSNQLKSLKIDKTKNMIVMNQINTTWQECQQDFQLLLENAYLDIMEKELPDDKSWDVRSLETHLDTNIQTSKLKERAFKKKISSYLQAEDILKKHKNRLTKEQKKFQKHSTLQEALGYLHRYIDSLEIQHFKLLSNVFTAAAQDEQYAEQEKEATLFQQLATDIFHQKPSLSARLRKLTALVDQETENVLFTKAAYFAKQNLVGQPSGSLLCKTEEEKQQRLLKLLLDQTTAIQGEQMDFTFLPAALQEFSKYSDEYQQEAVKKLQRIMNIPLENGSRTMIAGHPAIDKMKDYDLYKIRVINHNIGEDNLPRIMVKSLPSQDGREHWCVVGFSDEAHQKRQYARFARRTVKEWPKDPSQIVILNPPQTPGGHGPAPTPVPVPGGNGGRA